ncbi:MAG: GspH/FimT family pseudopilin [Deltaproteobacteria bacterium]|nr:GspH/FimT family pseudopilin [Deltaproteobacteria bacterium]
MRIPSKQRGFTLIEFITVLVITSILAYSAVTSFDFQSTRLDLAAKKLEADIQYAKVLALTRGETYGIAFEPNSNRYIVFVNSSATPIADPKQPTQSLIVNYSTMADFSGVTLVSASFGATSTLLFRAQGMPKDGNGTDLVSQGQVVLSAQGSSKTLNIAVGTGKVSS